MRLILIDDNKETYEVLKDVVSLSGSEIIYFDNVEDVKRYLEKDKDVDGIISEIYINGKPTSQIISYIKKINIDIPFIIITENITDEEKDYFKNLGVTQIMNKPFNPLEVLTEVVEYLKEKKR